MLKCPECGGARYAVALVHYSDGRAASRTEMCVTCQGRGVVPDTEEHRARQARIEEGDRRRLDRVARGVSLRDEARALGIKPEHLNAIENGLVYP